MINKIKWLIRRIIHFLTYEIWNVDTNGIGFLRKILYNILKAFVLTYRKINFGKINDRAAALTYRTLLAIVPLLAVLFAIARGFGFQNIVQGELFGYFAGQREVLTKAMTFVDKSLEYAKSGVFVGVGVIMLLYTVVSLLGNIEDNFNKVWKVKEGRSYYRQFTDYVALILIAPVFMVCNAGLSLFINAVSDLNIIGIVVSPVLKITPFAITILLFTFLYIYIPNTRIKFSSGLFAGIVAGTAFQIFQGLYIGGQIWISKYNAIYGSFAALPLLLLWMQLSWYICLIGVELSFSYQNVKKFNFERDTKDISRRYKDLVILSIMTLITKRFRNGEKPFTADELSGTYKIPTQLTSDIIYLLIQAGLIVETPSEDHRIQAYVPALDINIITVAYVFDKIDKFGTEDYNINENDEFKEEWNIIENIRKQMKENYSILVCDL
ncbi:YihY/virulence factor BrkB family protein [Dysgonomonas sp. 520]|uniref:YihY/virulence factor BrkB family protein n=1 Tax=Dysgonomonas sp. 520 TaxID=2302931 RepID=UPI0013D066DD|nr:YihY/virulence factor BrkB family protein [Dysgonomonas sp. 520]NDW08765.1 YihY/virulence factor BrkB family protein [Dysgonomonas sp. 520]